MIFDLLKEIENEEHKLLRAVRKFVKERVSPIAKEIDEKDEFPKIFLKKWLNLDSQV